MVKISAYRKVKEAYNIREGESLGEREYDMTYVKERKSKQTTIKQEIAQKDFSIQVKARKIKKSKPYMGQRVLFPPKKVNIPERGVRFNYGRTDACQNFIEEMSELDRYGYPVTSVQLHNPQNFERYFAVVYEFFAKHNERYFGDHLVWLLFHAEFIYTYLHVMFSAPVSLDDFIKSCYRVRTNRVQAIISRFGPGFLPRGYINGKKLDGTKIKLFVHRIPSANLLAAQNSFISRHYVVDSYVGYKAAFSIPKVVPTYKMVERPIVSNAQRRKQSKPVVKFYSTNPKEQVKQLANLKKTSVANPRMTAKDRGKLKVQPDVNVVRKDFEPLSNKEKKKSRQKSRVKNSDDPNSGLGKVVSSNNKGDGPGEAETIIRIITEHPGCTAVQIVKATGLDRSVVNAFLYSSPSVYKKQDNKDTKPTWFINGVEVCSAQPPVVTYPITPLNPNNPLSEEADMTNVFSFVHDNPGCEVKDVARALHIEKKRVNRLLYAHQHLRYEQHHPSKPPKWFVISAQLNGTHGEVTGEDDHPKKVGRASDKIIKNLEYAIKMDREQKGYEPLNPRRLQVAVHHSIAEHFNVNREWNDREKLYCLAIVEKAISEGTIIVSHITNVSDYVVERARTIFQNLKKENLFTGCDPSNTFDWLNDPLEDMEAMMPPEVPREQALPPPPIPPDPPPEQPDPPLDPAQPEGDDDVYTPPLREFGLDVRRYPIGYVNEVGQRMGGARVQKTKFGPLLPIAKKNNPYDGAYEADLRGVCKTSCFPRCHYDPSSFPRNEEEASTFRSYYHCKLKARYVCEHFKVCGDAKRLSSTYDVRVIRRHHQAMIDLRQQRLRQALIERIGNRGLGNNIVFRGCAPTYKPLIFTKMEEPTPTGTSSIPVGFMPLTEEPPPPKTCISMVTSKYALNKYGLFILRDGIWQQTKFAGGCGHTFKGLGITPIESQRLTGNYTEELDNVYTVGGEHCVLLNPIMEINDFVVSSTPYEWFSKLRTLRDEFGRPGFVYNGYTRHFGKIFVHRPLLDILRKRITAGVSDLVYNSIFGIANDNCDNPELALHTFLYFVEMKVVQQHRSVSNVDAHSKHLKRRCLYSYPTSGVSVDMFSNTYDRSAQGNVVFTTRDECHKSLRMGITNVQRDYYTNCSPEYGSYDNPVNTYGGMLEPLSPQHEVDMQKRGVLFSDPYIKFDYSESNVSESWQSVGGGFATSVKVINHNSTRQAEMAHSRLLFSRPDEIEQRLRATMYWKEVLNMFNSIQTTNNPDWNPDSHIRRLVKDIKRKDPQYCGSDRIFDHLESETSLEGPSLLQAFIQACVHDLYASLVIPEEEMRKLDSVQALEDYIEMIGAKLPLRRGLVQKIREMATKDVESKVNVVQCKPHEFQKYKIKDGRPVLKYARDVVSITNEDWIAAKPELIAYVKKSLESEVRVTIGHNNGIWEVHASLQNDADLFERIYTIPQDITRSQGRLLFSKVGKNFFYKAVISSTSLPEISEVLDRMQEAVVQSGDVYVITHGDDQLCLVFNDNPRRYNGQTGHVWIEGDINDNDGSHVDDFYRLDYLTFAVRGEIPIKAFSQLANPLMLANPNAPSQYGVFRRIHGMQMCSGSVHTTYGNSKMSANVGLTLYVNEGDDYSTIAKTVGMNVTSITGELTDVTFLSKNFYHDVDNGNRVTAYTDLASLLRKVGRCTGDVEGRSHIPCDVRFDDHNEGVVKGWVHEPDSLIIRMMRRRYIDEKPKHVRSFGYHVTIPVLPTSIFDRKLRPIDMAIIQHYYPRDPEKGFTDYSNLVDSVASSDTYGVLIKSPFIDRIMGRRYGMIPVIT